MIKGSTGIAHAGVGDVYHDMSAQSSTGVGYG